MKLNQLIAGFFLLCFLACKKENPLADVAETKNPSGDVAETKTEGYTICSNDTWSGVYYYNASLCHFVYNNKFYGPVDVNGTYPTDDRMNIFDGTNWHSIISQVPFHTNIDNYAFVIGNKGYAGSRHAGSRSFYLYNFSTNVWVQKADFPGVAESNMATFTVGSKAYVVGGEYPGGYTTENWEYNPSTNTWTKRKGLVLTRSNAAGFSIGSKGYIVNGRFPYPFGFYTSLNEYDPSTDEWTMKADFPGPGRDNTHCFVIDGNAYAGGGSINNNSRKDFYKYNPASNIWTRVDDIPLNGWSHGGFSINSKGYIVDCSSTATRIIRYNPSVCTYVLKAGSSNKVN